MSIAAQRVTAGRRELSHMLTEFDIAGSIDCLEAHALADSPGTMSDAQVDAAIALLDRVLPDLHRLELTTPNLGPILVMVAGGSKIEGE